MKHKFFLQLKYFCTLHGVSIAAIDGPPPQPSLSFLPFFILWPSRLSPLWQIQKYSTVCLFANVTGIVIRHGDPSPSHAALPRTTTRTRTRTRMRTPVSPNPPSLCKKGIKKSRYGTAGLVKGLIYSRHSARKTAANFVCKSAANFEQKRKKNSKTWNCWIH